MISSLRRGKAKNIIFLVSDGMNHGTLTLADAFKRLVQGESSHWTRLYRQTDWPIVRAMQETRSRNAIVTDSAAASSSWGCGARVDNRLLNMATGSNEGEYLPLEPIGVRAKKAGRSVGLVTTARITHATPAGFAANVEHRNLELIIANQYLEREIDILLGGGQCFYDPKLRPDRVNLYGEYRKAGYAVVRTLDKLLAVPADATRVLGCFYPQHLPYTIDRNNDPQLQATVPDLATMMRFALERLSLNPNGFILQVEGARVDHAGHANDVGAILWDQLAFDDCIPVACEFCRKHPDTLVILTTDHGTGGCMLNGEGSEYLLSAKMVENIAKIKTSFESLRQHWPDKAGAEEIQSLLEKLFGITVPLPTIREILPHIDFAATESFEGDQLSGTILAPILARFTAVHWTTQNHTGEHVELCAWGPGSETIRPFIENWQLHQVMCDAIGI